MPDSAGDVLLEAIGLVRRSGDQMLLDGVNLRVSAGDRWAVVGPSGAGKTLLLRSLALLDPLDEGEIRYRGRIVRGRGVPEFRRRVVYLHQRPVLYGGSVEDNLRRPFTLRVHRGAVFNRERIVGWLKALGRDPAFLLRQHAELSGGEAQLTALLRAVQLDPDVLLLDEPTAALDAAAVRQVEALVTQWLDQSDRQRAAVWVTHDSEQTRRVCNRIAVMHNGRLDARGTTEQPVDAS